MKISLLFIIYLFPLSLLAPLPDCKPSFVFRSVDHEVWHWLSYYNVNEKENWMRVARMESGKHCNSYLSRTQNNVFGMGHARARPTTSQEKKRGHAVYVNIHDSVYDLVLRLERYPQRENFYRYLKRTGYNISPESYEYTLKRVRISDLVDK